MNDEEVKQLPPLQRLLFWIRERYQIYFRRKVGKPKPWTQSRVLQTGYFCNPYRENDRTTVWYREHIREPLANSPDVLFSTIAFRWFNWIPTGRLLVGANLLRQWNLQRCLDFLGNYKAQGEQLFTGAFNISNSGSKKPKLNRVCEDYLQPVWEKSGELISFLGKNAELSKTHRFLSQYPGLGGSGFMSAQIIADLKYTPWLQSATDWWTWCSPGPGSIRGLNRLLGRPTDGPPPPNFLEEINRVRVLVHRALPHMPEFHAQDMQSCFCEFDKFERGLWGDGQLKRKYDGGV